MTMSHTVSEKRCVTHVNALGLKFRILDTAGDTSDLK